MMGRAFFLAFVLLAGSALAAGNPTCAKSTKYCARLKRCIPKTSNLCECPKGQSLMLDEDSPTYTKCVKLGSLPQGEICEEEVTRVNGGIGETLSDGSKFCSTKGAVCRSFEEDPDYDKCSCDPKKYKYCAKLDACIPKNSNLCECPKGQSLMIWEDNPTNTKCFKLGSIPLGEICDDEVTRVDGGIGEFLSDGSKFCSTKGAMCRSFEDDPDYDQCSCDPKKSKYCAQLNACIPKTAKCACPAGSWWCAPQQRCIPNKSKIKCPCPNGQSLRDDIDSGSAVCIKLKSTPYGSHCYSEVTADGSYLSPGGVFCSTTSATCMWNGDSDYACICAEGKAFCKKRNACIPEGSQCK